MQGKCLKFDRVRGIGFLISEDDPLMPDVFLHFSDLEPSPVWSRKFLLPGWTVTFDVEFDAADIEQERPRARHVRVVGALSIARQHARRGLQDGAK